jgi:hypothetical protein
MAMSPEYRGGLCLRNPSNVGHHPAHSRLTPAAPTQAPEPGTLAVYASRTVRLF